VKWAHTPYVPLAPLTGRLLLAFLAGECHADKS
jgi:hypothetical protein